MREPQPLTPGTANAASAPFAELGFAERLLAWIGYSHLRACACLILVGLVCFLPGFVSLQPMDRDEPRFAQASKQMLETGDFISIRFQDEARNKKPVGIHWLQAAAVTLGEAAGVPAARTTIALYRIPSLLGALSAILLTYWAALAFVARRHAFLAAGLIGASVILMVEARLAKTDAVLLACCVAAMGALARAYLGRREPLPRSTPIIFWLAIAAGILIKGPMVVMFAGLAAIVLSIRERSAAWLGRLRPIPGLAFTALVVAPWFIAIAVKTGGTFYTQAVGDDMLGKVVTGQQKHGAPPGFYLAAFFGTFWPGAFLAALAVPFAWRERRDDAVAFLIAWIVPAWLIFEAVPTKLPHYVMPVYPAVAILIVLALKRGVLGAHQRGARFVAILLPLMPVALTIALAIAAPRFGDSVSVLAWPVLALACALAILGWLGFARGFSERAILAGIAASGALAIGVLGLAQPGIASLKLSPRMAAVAHTLTCPNPAYGTLGYREPSLVFLLGTDLTMFDNGHDAAAWLGAGPCRMVFVTDRFEPAFRDAAGKAGLQPALSTRLPGFNINGGRRLEIGAYTKAP